mmetsp:Transcript_42645/g.110568  ORF Transcript_42645/g.110568 Transcript_42645/m.110568 type:complete len:399 (-) Transcript_42645:271-1467(-)
MQWISPSQRELVEEYERLLSPTREMGSATRQDTPEPLPAGRYEETVRVTPAYAIPPEQPPALPEAPEEVTPRAEVPQPSAYRPASGASSVHVPALDTDNLSMVLDDGCGKLKRDIMEFFLSAKSQVAEREAALVDQERREWTRMLAAKQEEIDALNDKCARKDVQAKRLTVSLMRAAEFRASTMTKAKATQLTVSTLAAWKQRVAASKAMKHRLRNWGAYYMKRYGVGSAFKSWRSLVHSEIHTRLKTKLAETLEQEKATIMAEQKLVMDGLRQEVEELSSRLHKEQAERTALEEHMKKAFMRGVCALNMEAMALMKSGHPPGGVNPVPSEAAPPSGEENMAPSVPADAALAPSAPLQAPNQMGSPASPRPGSATSQTSASAALERFIAARQILRGPR